MEKHQFIAIDINFIFAFLIRLILDNSGCIQYVGYPSNVNLSGLCYPISPNISVFSPKGN